MKKRLFSVGIICMVTLGLIGCRSEKKSPEEVVREKLFDKYHAEFDVGTLKRTRSNTFRNEYYTGKAWDVHQPQYRFDVWLHKDLSEFHDSYYVVKLLPQIDAWVQELADEQWDRCRARDEVELLSYHDDAEYDSMEDLFREENASHFVELFLPMGEMENQDLLIKRLRSFSSDILPTENGMIQVTFISEEQWKSLDIYGELPEDGVEIRTLLSAGEKVWRALLEKERKENS